MNNKNFCGFFTRCGFVLICFLLLTNGAYGQGADLHCRGFVNSSAGIDCTFNILAQELLTDNISGLSGFEITIGGFSDFDTLMLDSTVIGQQFDFTVTDTANDVTCWGYIFFEDASIPYPICGIDTIFCNQSILPDSLGFPIPENVILVPMGDNCYSIAEWDNCGDVRLCYEDFIEPIICDTFFYSKITRTWTVTDPNIGPNRPNKSSCESAIYIRSPDPFEVQTPQNFLAPDNSISCDDMNNNGISDRHEDIWPSPAGNGIIDRNESRLIGVTVDLSQEVLDGLTRANVPLPAVTGSPTLVSCGEYLLANWKDEIIENECFRLINRTWSLQGTCPLYFNDTTYVQQIYIVDNVAPILTYCPIRDVPVLDNDLMRTEALNIPFGYDECYIFPFGGEVQLSGVSCVGHVIEEYGNYYIEFTRGQFEIERLAGIDVEVVWTLVDRCGNSAKCVSDVSVIKFSENIILTRYIHIGTTLELCPFLYQSISNYDSLIICSINDNVSVTHEANCLKLSGSKLGIDTLCIVACDSIDEDLCDTIEYYIIVWDDFRCRSIVTLSVEEDCHFNISAQDLAINNISNVAGIEIDIENNRGHDSLILDSSFLGRILPFTLTDTLSGETCFGDVILEGLIVPTPACGRDTVLCYKSILPDSIGFPIPDTFSYTVTKVGEQNYQIGNWDDCSNINLAYWDSLSMFTCDSLFSSIIHRRWKVSNPITGYFYNSSMECVDTIYIMRPDFIEFVEPTNYTLSNYLSCEDLNDNGINDNVEDLYPVGGNGLPDMYEDRLQGISSSFNSFEVLTGDTQLGIPLPEITGYPSMVNCNDGIVIGWSDHIMSDTCSILIERNWRISSFCSFMKYDTSFIQYINIVDDEDPIISQCLNNYDVMLSEELSSKNSLFVPLTYDNCDNDNFFKGVKIAPESDIGTIIQDGEGDYYLQFDSTEFDTTSIDSLDITITWTLDDKCGNTTQCISTVTVIQGSLPVELINFTATPFGSKVQLNWTTATEINNKGFEIHRSTGGATWTEIGFVSGSGSSSVRHDYVFNDDHPHDGVNYYRLKQMDFNGDFEYSNVEQVDFSNEDGFNIYPNPTSGELIIEGEAVERITIFNSLGQVVKIFDSPERVISIEELQHGLYLFEIETQGKSESKTVVKL